MRRHLGVGKQFERTSEVFDRLFEAAQAVHHPAHGVDVGRLVGHLFEGPRDQIMRLLEMLGAIRQRVAQCVQRRGVVRAGVEHAPEFGDGLVDTVHALVLQRTGVEQAAIIRSQTESAVECRQRLIAASGLVEEIGLEQHRVDQARLILGFRLDIAQRFQCRVEPVKLAVDHGNAQSRLREGRAVGGNTCVPGQRVLAAFEQLGHLTEQQQPSRRRIQVTLLDFGVDPGKQIIIVGARCKGGPRLADAVILRSLGEEVRGGFRALGFSKQAGIAEPQLESIWKPFQSAAENRIRARRIVQAEAQLCRPQPYLGIIGVPLQRSFGQAAGGVREVEAQSKLAEDHQGIGPFGNQPFGNQRRQHLGRAVCVHRMPKHLGYQHPAMFATVGEHALKRCAGRIQVVVAQRQRGAGLVGRQRVRIECGPASQRAPRSQPGTRRNGHAGGALGHVGVVLELGRAGQVLRGLVKVALLQCELPGYRIEQRVLVVRKHAFRFRCRRLGALDGTCAPRQQYQCQYGNKQISNSIDVGHGSVIAVWTTMASIDFLEGKRRGPQNLVSYPNPQSMHGCRSAPANCEHRPYRSRPMPLIALGINHQTAPVSLRERVAFAPDSAREALTSLKRVAGVDEAAILSTCNRTEIYCAVQPEALLAPARWLCEQHALSPRSLDDYLYRHDDALAVRHIFRVATGLDSMVLGEPQILGQVKEAWQLAREAHTLGAPMDRLFQHTFAVAKRVRTDTRIGANPVSVAFAAVRLAERVFADLREATVLLIGAGETIELAARHLVDRKAQRIIVANRTLEHAQLLATRFGGYAIALADLEQHLAEADVVISSTASREAVLRRAQVEQAIRRRRHRPMFMVDIAVPRDIEPGVGDLPDVYLYSIDDLDQVIADGLKGRREAAREAEAIIDLQVEHYMAWRRGLDGQGPLKSMRNDGESTRDQLLERAQQMLARGKPADEVLAWLAHTLTNRLLHAPSANLREAALRGDAEMLSAAARLFQAPTGSRDNP